MTLTVWLRSSDTSSWIRPPLPEASSKSPLLYAAVCAVCLFLAACSWAPVETDVRAWPGPVVVDDDGVAVRLGDAPERVVALGPAQADMLLALGLDGELVASHELGPGLQGDEGNLLGGAPPSAAAVLAYEPDMVVGPPLTAAYREALAEHGVTVLVIHPRAPEDVPQAVRLLGLAAGRWEEGSRLAEELEERLNSLKELAAQRQQEAGGEPLSVYLEYGYRDGQVLAALPGSYADAVIRAVGAENALVHAAPLQAGALLAESAAAASRPDVVLAARPHVLTGMWTGSRPGWQNVPAVQAGQLYTVAAEPFLRPGTEFPRALEELIGLLYD